MEDALKNKVPWQVHAALSFVQVAFGSWHVFGKYVLHYLHPLVLADLRVLGSVPLLLGLTFMTERALPKKSDLGLLIVLGLLGVFANQLLYIFGLQHTSATNSGILMPSIPVFAAALAVLFRIERISIQKTVGIGLAVAGSIVMLDVGTIDLAKGGATLFGNLLLLGNCVCYAGFLVLQRSILHRMRPLAVVAWSYLFGGIGVIVVATPQLLSADLSGVPTLVWWAVAYIVLVPTTLTYALVSWAIKWSSPALVATYTTLQPVTAAILAWIFLGERAGGREAIGFVLIVIGLFVVSRAAHSRSSPRSTNPQNET
jgi:drug/metabolite transporter (DMT)-like permease